MTNEEFEQWMVEATIEKSRKLYKENQLEDAIDYVLLIIRSSPIFVKPLFRSEMALAAYNTLGDYLREYIRNNDGMPDEKVIQLAESDDFNFPLVYSDYILRVGSIEIPLRKVRNAILSSSSIFPTTRKQNGMSWIVRDEIEGIHPAMTAFALRLKAQPIAYALYDKERNVTIFYFELEQRLSVVSDFSRDITLKELPSELMIPPWRTKEGVDFMLVGGTDPWSEVA